LFVICIKRIYNNDKNIGGNVKNIKIENDLKLERKKAFSIILIYLGFSIIIPVIIAIIGMILFGENEALVNQLNNTATIVLNFIMFFLFLAIYFKRIKTDIKRLTKKNLIFILIISVLAVALNQIVSEIFETFKVQMSNQNQIIELLSNNKIPWIILSAFLIPFVEEALFRGSLSSIIKKKTLFIIVSSITFGLMHGFGISTLLYVLLGFIYTMIYIKTDKNLVASTIAHIINNVFGVILIIFLT